MAEADKLVLVDIYSQAYRSFHAIPRLTNSQGVPTNALYGMASFLLRLEQDFPHEFGAAVFDKGVPEARLEVLPEYKATRPPMPDELQEQIPLIREWAARMGWPVVEEEGQEADDLIAGVIDARPDAMQAYIVSSDKDLAQIVEDEVLLLLPGTKSSLNELTAEEVEKKWGVPPRAVPDYLALLGDSSDNIEGVPGVGKKTAAKLVQQFGSAEKILKNLPDVERASLREKLEQSVNLIRRNLSLITLDKALPQGWSGFESVRKKRPDWNAVLEMVEDYGLNSLRSRIDDLRHADINPSLF